MRQENELLKKVQELNIGKHYNEVIELLPIEILEKYRNANLYAEAAMAYWKTKRIELCKKMADEVIKLDSENTKGYHYLGNVYCDLREYDKSIKQYNKAIEIDPNYTFAYFGLGKVYTDLKDNEKAIFQYKKVLEINPKYANAYAYNNLGVLYFELKEYEKAKSNYKNAIKVEPSDTSAYYNLGLLYYNAEEYEKALNFYRSFIEIEEEKTDFFYKNAQSKMEEIEKILANHNYKVISSKIDSIKKLLLFKGDCITHYTGISTVQYLLINESPLRLSEGSFLNDTSEGQELFQFLEINNNTNNKQIEENFTKRPFIGSFVDASKNNDLTLWRMYGKEELEEAKGCSITINAKALKESINDKLSHKIEGNSTTTDDIEFYRVAYRKGDTFDFADSNPETCKNLMELMKELKIEVEKFSAKKDKTKKEEIEIIELLNEVAYLFKSIEYQYENEIRLVIKEGIGFDKKINFNPKDFKTSTEPFKVYIELVPVLNLLSVITIGPKVNKAEEWAATFHYHLANQNYKPEIHISKLPFK